MKIRTCAALISIFSGLTAGSPAFSAQAAQVAVPQVSSSVALSSLVALSDGHIQKIADSLKLAAATDEVRSSNWERMRPILQDVAKSSVESGFWFALSDGTYWTLEKGKVANNIADRPYFPKVLAGKTVVGDMVVSRSNGKSVAIVATPVFGNDGKVAGVLGATVELDKLAERIDREMGLDSTMIFYAFDSTPMLGMVWDPGLIFKDPRNLGSDVSRAFGEMLKKDHGVERYTFRGKQRVVVFQKSDVTGWWYAFGVVPQGRA